MARRNLAIHPPPPCPVNRNHLRATAAASEVKREAALALRALSANRPYSSNELELEGVRVRRQACMKMPQLERLTFEPMHDNGRLLPGPDSNRMLGSMTAGDVEWVLGMLTHANLPGFCRLTMNSFVRNESRRRNSAFKNLEELEFNAQVIKSGALVPRQQWRGEHYHRDFENSVVGRKDVGSTIIALTPTTLHFRMRNGYHDVALQRGDLVDFDACVDHAGAAGAGLRIIVMRGHRRCTACEAAFRSFKKLRNAEGETYPLKRQMACACCNDRVHLPHDAVEISDVWRTDPGVSGPRVLSPVIQK